MNKRGISPLIASVLIIGFTIVLAAMVMLWGTDMFKNYQEKTTFNSQLKLDCATKVSLNIKEACDLGIRVRLKLENMGEVNIEGFRLRIISPFGIHSEENSNVLAPFSLSNFERPYVLTSSPDKLDIFPKIKVDGKEGTCSAVSKNIESCFKLPSTLSCEGWIVGGGECGVIEDVIKESADIKNALENANSQGIKFLTRGIIFSSNSESEDMIITSEGFVIPEEADFISIGGLSSGGSISYELIIQEEFPSNTIIDITQNFDVTANLGKTVNFVIKKSGGGFATVSQINYEIN